MITGGGIRNMSDINKLKNIGIKNVIFGRAFYDGNISLDDLKEYFKK
jgi:phosphoribosylformimino-5-aminoimidazole carboxamide ribotide isomerase